MPEFTIVIDGVGVVWEGFAVRDAKRAWNRLLQKYYPTTFRRFFCLKGGDVVREGEFTPYYAQ